MNERSFAALRPQNGKAAKLGFGRSGRGCAEISFAALYGYP